MKTSNIFGTSNATQKENKVEVALVLGTNVSGFSVDNVSILCGELPIINCTGELLKLPNEVKVFDLKTSSEELANYLKAENYLIKTLIVLPTLPDIDDIPPTFDIINQESPKLLFATNAVVVDIVDAYWRTKSYVSGDRQFNKICGYYVERSELKKKYINCHSMLYDAGGELKTPKSTITEAVMMIAKELEDRNKITSPSLALACLIYKGVQHYMGDGQFTTTRD